MTIGHMQQLARQTSITPAALPSGPTNDYAPVDATSGDSFTLADTIRQTANAAGSIITGILAFSDGALLIIENIGTSGNLTLSHESSSSSAANRFTLPGGADFIIPPGGAATLAYDGVTSRWRLTTSSPAPGVSGIGSGTVNKVARFTGSTTVGDSSFSDDGIKTTLSRIVLNETLTTPGVTNVTLGPGPIDLVRGSNNMIVCVTPDIAGTTIRSARAVVTNNFGERLIIYNRGNSVNPKDYLIMITQDDPGGTELHFHLGGRQPWLIIPPLEWAEFVLHPDDTKWHHVRPGDLALTPRPVMITTAVLAASDLHDWSPTDASSGMSHKFASWIQAQASAGTAIGGFDTTITAGSNASRRILITNFSNNNLVFRNLAAGSTKKFKCPNNADYTLRQWGSVWIIWDPAANLWFIEAV